MLNYRVARILVLFSLSVMALPHGTSPFNGTAQADDWKTIHQQMGATGKNGYRPMTSRAYQSSARFHAQALNSYGTTIKEVPVETAREHLSQVKAGVAAVKKEISKIDAETATKAGITENLAKLKTQLADCEKTCSLTEKAITDDKVDSVAVCSHCASLEKQLKAIQVEEAAMLKKMGIELPDAHNEHHEHTEKK